MAIRRSKTQKFQTATSVNDAIKKCELALSKGGFKNITTNKSLKQLGGQYKKFTVWGEIEVALFEVNGETEINIKSTANVDNIFALFSSPNNKILKAFSSNFES